MSYDKFKHVYIKAKGRHDKERGPSNYIWDVIHVLTP